MTTQSSTLRVVPLLLQKYLKREERGEYNILIEENKLHYKHTTRKSNISSIQLLHVHTTKGGSKSIKSHKHNNQIQVMYSTTFAALIAPLARRLHTALIAPLSRRLHIAFIAPLIFYLKQAQTHPSFILDIKSLN